MAEGSSNVEVIKLSADMDMDDKTIQEKVPKEYQSVAHLLKEYQRSYQIAGEMIDVLAPERNFQIRMDYVDDSVSFTLQRNDENEVNLNSFIAEGYKLKLTSDPDSWGTNHAKKEVYIPNTGLEKRGYLLNVLHEFGHTHQTPPKAKDVTLHQSLEAAKHLVHIKAKSFLSHFRSKNTSSETESDRQFNLQSSLEDELPNWLFDKIDEGDVQNERDAWAFSLHHARELEKAGYNALAGFENNREIIDYVNSYLFTNEYNRLARILKQHGNEGVKNYIPRYVRTKTPTK